MLIKAAYGFILLAIFKVMLKFMRRVERIGK